MEDTIAEMSDLDQLLESVEGLNLSSSSHRDTYLAHTLGYTKWFPWKFSNFCRVCFII